MIKKEHIGLVDLQENTECHISSLSEAIATDNEVLLKKILGEVYDFSEEDTKQTIIYEVGKLARDGELRHNFILSSEAEIKVYYEAIDWLDANSFDSLGLIESKVDEHE